MPEPIIHVADLTKVYRNYDRREGLSGALLDLFNRRHQTLRAVDGVSFDIGRGEIVGYIGANGAGKSTTIKMLTGILTPTGGEIVVNGLVPHRQRYAHARQIGVVFGQRTQLWWDLAVIEAFHLLQKIYRVPETDYRRRLDRFVGVLDIGGQLHQPVRKLSLGQRMKCDLAASLLHAPPILFLDEPTIGLDVAVKERVRAFIREINAEEQTTIILTTHDLTDIEELCERLIILDTGKVLYDGSREEIYSRFGRRRRVIVEFRHDHAAIGVHAAAVAGATTASPAVATDERRQPDPPPETAQPGDLDAALHPAQSFAAAEPLDPDPEADAPITTVARRDNGPAILRSAPWTGRTSAAPADSPAARAFMAQLAALRGDGTELHVERLGERRYQLGFDRTAHRAGDVLGRLLGRYEVEDLELHEPELSDIVRAIYNRQ